MHVYRKYGEGGYIAFSEYEIEAMYYTVGWLAEVILLPETKQALQEARDQLAKEVNLLGITH